MPDAPLGGVILIFDKSPGVDSNVVVTYSYPYVIDSEVPSEPQFALGLQAEAEQVLRDNPKAAVKVVTLPSTKQSALVGRDPEQHSLGIDFRGGQGQQVSVSIDGGRCEGLVIDLADDIAVQLARSG